jgi:hypothetical protein
MDDDWPAAAVARTSTNLANHSVHKPGAYVTLPLLHAYFTAGKAG